MRSIYGFFIGGFLRLGASLTRYHSKVMRVPLHCFYSASGVRNINRWLSSVEETRFLNPFFSKNEIALVLILRGSTRRCRKKKRDHVESGVIDGILCGSTENTRYSHRQ